MGDYMASFVIPAYIKNETYLNFLKETLDGLINQSDEKWNAIVIEDCSPEKKVRNLLNHYMSVDKRIHCIFLDTKKTTGMCRNIGIKWAKSKGSDIILFNDADDISHRDRLKRVKSIFRDNPNVSVVYTNIKIIDEFSDEVPKTSISPPILEILDGLKENQPVGKNCWYDIGLITGYINVTSATSVRIELAVQELFPDEYVSEDSHTWFRYAARGEFFFINEALTYYRIPSFVTRQSSDSYVEDFNLVKNRVDLDGFSRALDIVIQKGVLNQANRNLLEAKFLLRLAESMGKDGRLDLAFDLAMKCKEKLAMVSDGVKNV